MENTNATEESIANDPRYLLKLIKALSSPSCEDLGPEEDAKVKARVKFNHCVEYMIPQQLNACHLLYAAATQELHGTALYYAVWLNNWEETKTLIAHGADVNMKGMTRCLFASTVISPLFVACRKGNVEMIRLLVKHGANVNDTIYTQSILEREKYRQNIEINEGRRDSFVHWLVENNKPEVVEELLACGADLHTKNSSGRSALKEACIMFGKGWCSVNMLRTLLRHGADIISFTEDPDTEYWSCVFDCFGALQSESIFRNGIDGIHCLLSARYMFNNRPAVDFFHKAVATHGLPESCSKLISDLLLQPSCLMQICRATIRKMLGLRCRPSIISSLPTPCMLQRYLCLEELWHTIENSNL